MEYQDDHEAIIDEDDGDGGWVDTHHNLGKFTLNLEKLLSTQQNFYSKSHLIGKVTTQ